MKKLLLICSIFLLGISSNNAQTLDATFSIVGGARLQMVLNTDATFQFSESYFNAGGVTVIVKNLYNSMPSPGSTGTATGPSYSTTGGLSGNATQMGTYQADFGSFIAATDEEITFSISSTINNGDYFTLPAGVYIQNLPGNYGGGQTFNAGPYVAVISNQGFTGTAATLVAPPAIGDIALTGNTVNIVNGDATPQIGDFTDFESGCTAITKSFALHNYSNTADITLTGSAPNYVTLTGSSDFSISLQPSSGTIAKLSNLNFDVTFTPSGSGIKTAIVSIPNNDVNEAPFTFTVQGNAALPAVVVSKNNSTPGTVKGPNQVDRTFTLTSGELGGCTSLSEVELEINLLIGSGTNCNIGSSAYGVHGDLAIQLTSPSGTKVQLVQDDWGYFTGNAAQTITYADAAFPSVDATVYFDDDAIVFANNETSMTSGNRKPHNPLSAFDGEDATGTWTVSVADGNAQYSASDYVCFVNANLNVTCGSGGACPVICTDPDVPTITPIASTICPSGSTTLNWTGSLNDATQWHVYTTSCGVTQLTTTTGNSLVVSPASTTTYYIRGEDGAGCVDESTGLCGSTTITVQDFTNPTISCPGNQVGSAGASCTFTLPDYTPLATAADNCTASPTVTQSPAPGTIVGVGTTNIVFTATDGSSNTANCNFDVVVSDNTNPTITCPGNQVGSAGASCTFTLPDYTPLATAADNCPGLVVTQSPAPGTNVGIGTTSIVFTATDGASNTANCNFDVVVSDNTNPTISCPGNQVGSAGASCTFTLPDYTPLATAADNCPGLVVTQSPAPGTNVGIGTTNIVFTTTDGASNTANCNFDVVVSDNTNPTITCPGDQLESIGGACSFTLPDYTALATVADNCTASPTVTQVPAAGTVVGYGSTTITLTATDGSSNTASCNFDVDALDLTPPTAICQNINVYLDGAGTASIVPADIDGGSSDNCSLSLIASKTAFTCADLGPNNVNLTAFDNDGNIVVCVAVVTVIDTISPVTTCPGNQIENPDVSCNFTLPDYTSLVTASDNCNPAPTVTQSPVAGTVISGTTTLTMTSDDGNGNTSQCTFDVTLNDASAPTAVCQNINAYLDGAGNATIVAADLDGGSTDNCSGLTFSASATVFTCADLGANNVTLTVTDGNANSSNCVAVVTIIDTISPAVTCPGNQVEAPTTSCQFTLPDYTGLATASDNCNPAPTVTQSPVAGTAVGLGATTITLTADDGNGNTSSCTFDVTVSSSITGVQNETICNGGSVDVNGTTYSSATSLTGTETFTAANGCDSVVTVTVTELPALTGVQNETVCDGGSIDVNGTTYDAGNLTGVETFTNVGPNSCDSLVTVTLTIEAAVDATVDNTLAPTLTANQTGATYQWVDCDNANAPIPLATNASYTATVNGNYAVEVTVGSCMVTSGCENITGVGVKEVVSNVVSIYPNPTSGLFTISLTNANQAINYTVTTLEGRIVEQANNVTQRTIEVDLTNESKGVYFLIIQENDTNTTHKIIRQ